MRHQSWKCSATQKRESANYESREKKREERSQENIRYWRQVARARDEH
jgi:hypothetical protein